MYCPTCGTHLAEPLSFCKQCGASLETLTRTGDSSHAKTIETLGWVIAGTSITLLGMALGALVLIKEAKIDAGLGTIFFILSLVGFVLVEGVLLWRLRRESKTETALRSLGSPAQDLSIQELSESPAENLLRAGEMPDITAETTKRLEPSYRND
jgi:hypothetical protein